MFRPDTMGGFDYRPALALGASPQSRLAIMAGAMTWGLTPSNMPPRRRLPKTAKSERIGAMPML